MSGIFIAYYFGNIKRDCILHVCGIDCRQLQSLIYILTVWILHRQTARTADGDILPGCGGIADIHIFPREFLLSRCRNDNQNRLKLFRIVSGIGIAFIQVHYGWGVALGSIAGFALIGMVLFAFAWNANATGYKMEKEEVGNELEAEG